MIQLSCQIALSHRSKTFLGSWQVEITRYAKMARELGTAALAFSWSRVDLVGELSVRLPRSWDHSAAAKHSSSRTARDLVWPIWPFWSSHQPSSSLHSAKSICLLHLGVVLWVDILEGLSGHYSIQVMGSRSFWLRRSHLWNQLHWFQSHFAPSHWHDSRGQLLVDHCNHSSHTTAVWCDSCCLHLPTSLGSLHRWWKLLFSSISKFAIQWLKAFQAFLHDGKVHQSKWSIPQCCLLWDDWHVLGRHMWWWLHPASVQ